MKKRCILITLVIATAIFGFSNGLYAASGTDMSKNILTLIEEGVVEKENERYQLALQKYKEAVVIIENMLAAEPGNRRALLLKKLLKNKIEQCKSEIYKIEEEIDSNLPYKRALEEAYLLIEGADRDRNANKFYVALKKYSQAKEKIEFALEGISKWQEAKILLELAGRRIASCRDEIARLDGTSEREIIFSKNIDKIIKNIERAANDEEEKRFLIALRGYVRALKLLENLEGEYPGNSRISLVKEMINIKIEECRRKIEEIEREIELAEVKEKIERVEIRPPEKRPKRTLRDFIDTLKKEITKLRLLKRIKPEEREIVEIPPLVEEVEEEIVPEKKVIVEEVVEEVKPEEVLVERLMPERVPEVVVEKIEPEIEPEIKPEVKPEVVIEEVKPAPPIEAPPRKLEWIEAKKKRPTGYDLSDYQPDTEVTFLFEGREFKLDTPCLRKGNEIWVPVKEFIGKLGLVYLQFSETTIGIISFDGVPLEMNLGESDVLVNKKLFLVMHKPLAIYNGNFMLSLDSLKDALGILYEYFPDTNTVEITREKKAKFTTFTVEKPPVPVEEKEEIKRPEEKILPREIRKELLPEEYYPDIDLTIDSNFRYFHDMLEHQRLRYNEYFLKGKMYDVDVYGHLSMRDFSSGEKRTFEEDAQHLSFFKDGAGIKLFDNYFRLPGVRVQSQPYWGAEVVDKSGPFKSYAWIGEMDPVTIPSIEGGGTFKYFGNLYAAKQDWIDSDDFRLSAVELFTQSHTEFSDDNATTTYPRRNFLYLLDSSWQIRPELNLYNTFAQCNYVPENRHDYFISDYDTKTGFKLTHERFSVDSSFEFVGDRYASLGIPSTYQDYIGYDVATNFKVTEDLSLNVAGNISRDNVAFNEDYPTTHNRAVSTSSNINLPWEQSVSGGWSYNRYLTRGGFQDASGSEYNSYRIDYYKMLGTASLQLGWNHYRMDPLATNTGSLFYHTYSATIYKSFPSLYGSYIRFYQDLTKRKELSMDTLPTVTTWNTNLSAKYYLLPYLSFSGDFRLLTTQQEQVADSSVLSISAGVDYNPAPDTTVGFTYEVDNINLYDEHRTTDDWSILLHVRHIFDVGTPEKWGRVKVYVFEDLNTNDIKDTEESGIENILAYVVKGRGVETNSDGMALIKKVVPGEREVRIDMRSLPVDVVIKGEQTKGVTVDLLKTSEVTFVLVTTGVIKGRLFIDMNKDGVFDRDVDIPIPNVRVYLTPEYMDTLSFSDGSYLFEYVYPGYYEVNIDLEGVPRDYKLTSPGEKDIQVESEETVEDVDFIFESRPIKVKYF